MIHRLIMYFKDLLLPFSECRKCIHKTQCNHRVWVNDFDDFDDCNYWKIHNFKELRRVDMKTNTRIKIFEGLDCEELEDDVNKFMAHRNIVDVKIETSILPFKTAVGLAKGYDIWKTIVVRYE